jgi:hypothetical protein
MTHSDRLRRVVNDAYFKGLIANRDRNTLEDVFADAMQAYIIAKCRSARWVGPLYPRKITTPEAA